MTNSFSDTLREASEFFAKRGRIYDTLDNVTRRLGDEGIEYAVIGALALVAHGYERFTIDVDLMTTSDGLDAVHERLVGHGYSVITRKRLLDLRTEVNIDFIVASELPEVVKIDGYNIIALPKLVELKIVCGRQLAWLKHLADVQELIKAIKPPRDFGAQLDPSVRDEYYRIWDASQVIHDPSAS